MPKVMGVLSHLDMLKNNKTLKRTKKLLKHRFWTEVYAGAKLFYLSGVHRGEYVRNEVKNLGRFISVMKFRPLTWQTSHSYVLGKLLVIYLLNHYYIILNVVTGGKGFSRD
jgi:ribosome biogenesis protein BMS1